MTGSTDPTTQAAEALLDDIGQLVRTIRIAAKVPDSEIVPGATREHFLERIAAIEAEAAAAARAEAEGLRHAGLEWQRLAEEARAERDAANRQLAALRKTGLRVLNAAGADQRREAEYALEQALANIPAAAQEWEQRIRSLAYAELTMGPVSEEAREYVVNDWLASPDAANMLTQAILAIPPDEYANLTAGELGHRLWLAIAEQPNGVRYLDLASPDAKRRLAAVFAESPLFWEVRRPDGAFVMARMLNGPDEAAQYVADSLRSQAASQPEQGESDLERRQNAARQRDRQAYYEKGRSDGERAASQPAEPVE